MSDEFLHQVNDDALGAAAPAPPEEQPHPIATAINGLVHRAPGMLTSLPGNSCPSQSKSRRDNLKRYLMPSKRKRHCWKTWIVTHEYWRRRNTLIRKIRERRSRLSSRTLDATGLYHEQT